MTVPIIRKLNIEPNPSSQTSIDLNPFDTVLKTAITRTELKRSWSTIERDINIQEYLDVRQRQLRDWL
jgi:hypothetical protein